jgi:hypothetical protein
MADEEFQKESPPPKVRRERSRRPPLDDEDDDRIRRPSAVESLIPYKNPKALIAYYCGVFAVIPCVGLLLGPTALILGILGIRYRNKHPTAGGLGHAITGVVLGSLTTAANWGVALLALVGGVISGMK